MEDLKKLVDIGLDTNIIVYDSMAFKGQFTPRLISLMASVMREDMCGHGTHVYFNAAIYRCLTHFLQYFLHSVPQYEWERLERHYTQGKQGMFAEDDEHLIMMVDYDVKEKWLRKGKPLVVLGSY